MKKHASLFWLGILCLCFWVVDVANVIFVIHKPAWLLWFSSLGLILTAVALLTQSALFIFVLFVSHFVLEAIWTIGFFSILLFNKGIPGITDYAFTSHFAQKDFLITLYHVLIPPSLLWGLLKTRKVYKSGWIWATLLTSLIAAITYIFVEPHEKVNCIHSVTYCSNAFSDIFNKIQNPNRIFLGLALLTFFVFIPTNFIASKMGKALGWK